MPYTSTASKEKYYAALAEAENFNLPDDWQDGRELLHGIAIDPSWTPDVDDAISVARSSDGNYELRVSISDVGSFLARKSAIVSHAEEMGWSHYRGERVVDPMLPRRISENCLSLQRSQERPVLTTRISINENGQPIHTRITRDRIITKRYSHTGANRALRQGYEKSELRELERVADIAFIARGGTEVEGFVSEEVEGRKLSQHPNQSAEFIVRECMVMANFCIAGFMKAKEIPALYRNQALMPQRKNDLPEEVIDLLRRKLGYATYDPESKGHVGLELPTYAHATSPLRRFSDFVNHCNLAAYLDGQRMPYPVNRLGAIATRLNMLEKSKEPQWLIEGDHRIVQALQRAASRSRK
ncbi:MAG: ribonuclease [Candidatus Saccharibacteria bacterium]|nr:ribonuclease [Candidatus Saccharibacteria bacterium]